MCTLNIATGPSPALVEHVVEMLAGPLGPVDDHVADENAAGDDDVDDAQHEQRRTHHRRVVRVVRSDSVSDRHASDVMMT